MIIRHNRCFLVFTIVLGVALISVAFAGQSKRPQMIKRISVKDAYQKVQSGQALLVCSYDDESCKQKLLDGALLRSDFEARLPSLSKNQEIIADET